MQQNANRKIRILTVDDHPLLREGIAAILALQSDMQLVGEAETGAQALESFRLLKPDIVLMDLQMPGMGGLEAMKAIRQEFPDSKFIVLTTYTGDVQALNALKAGASAYLLKSALRKELLEAIRRVCAGQRFILPEVASDIAEHAADDQLTDREVGVLVLVAKGRSNKEIAHNLSISEDTVKAHMKSIFAKLDVSDRTQAVIVAGRRGIIAL